MKRSAVALCALLGMQACSSATQDTAPNGVATAGGRLLPVEVLARALGQSTVPVRIEEVQSISDLWIDYQLLAKAAASGDSLADPKLLDNATWAQHGNARAIRFYNKISATWSVPVADPKAMYASGRIITARQILLTPPTRALPLQAAEIRASIDSLRRSLTPANFAEKARSYSVDEQSKLKGGLLPAWPSGRNMVVPELEAGILFTKPGAISPMISSELGIHIIYRPRYEEVAGAVRDAARTLAIAGADSAYFAQLLTANQVTVVPDAPARVHAIAADLYNYADSATVIAAMKGGDFTAKQLVRWVNAYPAEEGMQGQLLNAPDTAVATLVRRIVRNELFLRQADSAGVVLTEAETAGFRRELRGMVAGTWGTLGIDPRRMSDSVKRLPLAEREKLFGDRIDAFIVNMVRDRGLVVKIPRSLRTLLRARYPGAHVLPQGAASALEGARRVRSSVDSARNARSGASDSAGTPGAGGQGAASPAVPAPKPVSPGPRRPR